MKHGYTCECGWSLERGRMKRRTYAGEKEQHARYCRACANEIRQSRKLQPIPADQHAPFPVRA